MKKTIYLPNYAKEQLETFDDASLSVWSKPIPYRDKPEKGFTCKTYLDGIDIEIADVIEGNIFYPDRAQALEDVIERMEFVKAPKEIKKEVEKKEKIFRIRKYSGYCGQNHYHHADIIETHYMKALAAARQGRVTNWRWIDTYDSCKEDYEWFEYLGMIGEVGDIQAENPAKPISKR